MRTYVIGISGLSGSGKSTFSEDLKECLSDLKVAVIHMDRYYKEESLRPKIKGIFDGKEYIDDNHPMALDLDRCYRDIQEAIHAEYDILIVEGFFSFYDTRIFNLLDFKIFVDCDADERAGRRILRHLSFGQNVEEETRRYVQAVQPRQKEYVEPAKWSADIIWNGISRSALGMKMIENGIRAELNQKHFLREV